MEHKISPSVLDLIRLMRPKFQFPSVISMVVGLLYSLYSTPFPILSLESIISSVLVTGPFVAGGALVLNQVFDHHYDIESRKRSLPIASGAVSSETAACLSVALLILGAMTSLLIGVETFVVTILAIFSSIAYSVPPLRLKARFALDSVSNGLCYGVFPTLVGWTVVLSVSLRAFAICIPLFLFFTANHLLLAIPDMFDDKRAGIVTTAVSIGERNTIKIAVLLWLLSLLLLVIGSFANLLPYQIVSVIPIVALAIFELSRVQRSNLKKMFSRLRMFSLVMGLVFVLTLAISIA